MTVNSVVHLNFRGEARTALESYQSAFGGDIAVVTYSDAHNVQDPSEANQIMWGQVAAPAGFNVMAYDVPVRLPLERGGNSFFVSVRGDDVDEITRYWDELADGAAVLAPLAPAQWGPIYGMLKDKFGIVWVLDVTATYDG